jgi:hypothetical protein
MVLIPTRLSTANRSLTVAAPFGASHRAATARERLAKVAGTRHRNCEHLYLVRLPSSELEIERELNLARAGGGERLQEIGAERRLIGS